MCLNPRGLPQSHGRYSLDGLHGSTRREGLVAEQTHFGDELTRLHDDKNMLCTLEETEKA